jgi:hypothetical protein
MKGIFKLVILVFLLSLLVVNVGCVTPRIVSTCFYDSGEILGKRLPLIISGAPGVKKMRRLWTECKANDECLCYEVKYKGDINDFLSYLQDGLQKSSVRSFRMEPKGDDRLEVYFDLEFKEF